MKVICTYQLFLIHRLHFFGMNMNLYALIKNSNDETTRIEIGQKNVPTTEKRVLGHLYNNSFYFWETDAESETILVILVGKINKLYLYSFECNPKDYEFTFACLCDLGVILHRPI